MAEISNGSVILSDVQLYEAAPIFFEHVPIKKVSVLDHDLFFVSDISFVNRESYELCSGVLFLTPVEIMYNTDCKAVFQEKILNNNLGNQGLGALAELLMIPFQHSWTGVFVVSNPGRNALLAIAKVNRILALCALQQRVSGRILLQCCIRRLGAEAVPRWVERFRMPALHFDPRGHPLVQYSHAAFREVLSLMAKSTDNQFMQGKEDYRLLALDTIADARLHTNLVLQYAQLWMAVEILLSFEVETTQQLALTLSGIVPLADRVGEFEKVKAAYKIRSQIVHGYKYARELNLTHEIFWIMDKFVFLFEMSLHFSKAEELKKHLRNRVLLGGE